MKNGSKNEFVVSLEKALEALGVSLFSQATEILGRHFDNVLIANRTMNLTRLIDPVEAAFSLYADSLAVFAWWGSREAKTISVLDIGTGAGFPVIPLAVAKPDWRFTAIDSTRKKVEFLRRAIEQLEISNVEVEHAHTAHWKTDRRFDLVVLKAFGPLVKCVAQSARFVAPGGKIVAYKTAAVSDEERKAAEAVCKRLHLKIEEPFAYRLPSNSGWMERLLFLYKRDD